VCEALHARGLVYSRPGYGRSSAPTERKRDVDYLHHQAHEVLPKVLDALHVQEPVTPFGHSDGGTIALLFAARFPERTRAAVVLAPHIFVEDVTVRGVERSLAAYEESREQRVRLGRYQDDPDAVFRAWTTIWLDPRFRDWNIEREIAQIRCSLLAIQGRDDEYATLEQVRGIARGVARTQVLDLEHCGHFPQRDQPVRVIDAVVHFLEAP
jgi:pimeloyl-ACP methyl ester carboxylesterase